MVSEAAGLDETSGDKYQYHFSTIIIVSGPLYVPPLCQRLRAFAEEPLLFIW